MSLEQLRINQIKQTKLVVRTYAIEQKLSEQMQIEQMLFEQKFTAVVNLSECRLDENSLQKSKIKI
jgi:hypothetical protein